MNIDIIRKNVVFSPTKYKGHATQIVDLVLHRKDIPEKKIKFKFTYECGNAYENFSIKLFDGTQMNVVATMYDLGFESNTKAYHNTQFEFKQRVEELYKESYEYIKSLFS